jgi:recombinational DNA repair ATPase RecF
MHGDSGCDLRRGLRCGSERGLDGHSLNDLRFRVDWGVALASISLRGFRNLEPTSVDFAESSNYLFGPNGAGKTNLLEAIHYLAIGRSFRRCPDADMLGFGKDVLAVSGTDESGDTAEIRFDGREKRILRNGIPVEKLSEYFGWLPVVVLLLEDIELVKGAPGIRRSFLDMAISKAGPSRKDSYHKDTKTQSQDGPKSEVRRQNAEGRSEGEERAGKSEGKSQEPKVKSEERSYIALTAEYRRAVSQYNRLLERSGAGREPVAEQLSAWEEELVLSGVPVYEARLAKVGGLLENAARHYERLAGHGAVFSYRSSVVPAAVAGESFQAKPGDSPGESQRALRRDSPRFCGTVPVFASSAELAGAFRQRLAATRERARALGHAVVGPHRDDIRITRGERELRKFGSVGEQRLAGIALRLAEADMILSAGRQRPVFLLDEVASELDEQRSRMVLEMVSERGQMVYAAARRMGGSGVRGFEGSGSEDSVHDRSASQNLGIPEPQNPLLGKEFHVEAGKVSEVS